MTDTMTKKQRSALMSRIRSKRTRPEMKFHGILKGRKIAHKMWPDLPGHPDCLIYGGGSARDQRGNVAVFVHGCFWHGCPAHYRLPKSNRQFWADKVIRNKLRHVRNAKTLRRMGYRVLVVWEHELRGGYSLFLKKRA